MQRSPRNQKKSARPSGSAFTLLELLVAVAVIALLLGLLVPAASRGRAAALRVECFSNVRQNLTAMAAYSVDDRDTYPDWSWKPGNFGLTPYADIRQEMTDGFGSRTQTVAATLQAFSKIRERFQVEAEAYESFLSTATWHPWPRAWNILISDYLDSSNALPETGVCPEDAVRVDITRSSWDWPSLRETAERLFPPGTPVAGAQIVDVVESGLYVVEMTRSSYSFPPAFWDINQSIDIGSNGLSGISATSPTQLRVFTGSSLVGDWGRYRVPQETDERALLGDVPTATTAQPSAKGMLYEHVDRHEADRFFLDGDAVPTIGFADGSVRKVRGRDLTFGWQPRVPSQAFTQLNYFPNIPFGEPLPAEPLTNPNGEPFQRFITKLEYTRGGLKGRDIGTGLTVGLDEIPTWWNRDF